LGKAKWDRFSLYLINDIEHLKELESLLLHIALPKGNKQLGKFSKSKSLKLELVLAEKVPCQ